MQRHAFDLLLATVSYTLKAMPSVLPQLLLTIVLLRCEAFLSPTQNQDCNATNVVLKEGETRQIIEEHETRNYSKNFLFVKPEPGFKGFHLNVQGRDDNEYVAWFPVERECFKFEDQWYEVMVSAWKETSHSNTLFLGFLTVNCTRYCRKIFPLQSLRRFSVVAHGSSKWSLENPSICDTLNPIRDEDWIAWFIPNNNSTLSTCKLPPAPATTSPPPATTSPLSGVMVIAKVLPAVFLLVLAALATRFWRIRRQQQQQQQQQQLATSRNPASPSQPSEPASYIYTIENDMYQSSDQYADTTNTSIRQEGGLYVMENELYESFTGHGHGHNR